MHQLLHQLQRHLISHLQAHHLATHPPFAQALLKRFHQVIGFQFAQLQVGIAGDAEEVVPFDVHPGEQTLQIEGHELLQWQCHEQRLGCAAPMQFRRDADETRQILLRNLQACELLLPCAGIADRHRDVQAEVADEREGMGWIHRQWRQHRKHSPLEIAVRPVLLFA